MPIWNSLPLHKGAVITEAAELAIWNVHMPNEIKFKIHEQWTPGNRLFP